MSRKHRKNQRTSLESTRSESPRRLQSVTSSIQSTASSVMDSTKSTLSSAASTANNHRVLIGSVLAGCGAVVALFATQSGRRLRSTIGEQISSLSSQVTEQASGIWSQVKSKTQSMLSSEEMVEDIELDFESEGRSSRTRRAA